MGKVSDGNYSFHCVAFMICNLLHFGLVFITFTVGITCMVEFYDIYGYCYIYGCYYINYFMCHSDTNEA